MTESCICCGAIVPEGRQVCPMCEGTQVGLMLERKAMTADYYQSQAMRTVNRSLGEDSLLIDGVLGLCGEAGECADIVKKAFFQGHKLDKQHLAKELGDVAWYIALTAYVIGYDLGKVLSINIEKLKERYPDGFDEARSRTRGAEDI